MHTYMHTERQQPREESSFRPNKRRDPIRSVEDEVKRMLDETLRGERRKAYAGIFLLCVYVRMCVCMYVWRIGSVEDEVKRMLDETLRGERRKAYAGIHVCVCLCMAY
jgi:plasmid stability protein